MKFFKFCAVSAISAIITTLAIGCSSEPVISVQTMAEVDSLMTLPGEWSPQDVNEVKNVLVKCYQEITPTMVNIAKKSESAQEWDENAVQIEKETAAVQKLYDRFMISRYTQLQYDDVMKARKEMQDKVSEAKKN